MTRRPIPITRHISLIYRYAQRFLSGRLRDFPLEAGQLPLMLQLYRYPGVTQEQLAQRLAIDKGTAARGVAQLEKNGLVERREDPADRRAYRLAPTSRALSLEEPLFAITDLLQEALFEGMNDDERRQSAALVLRMAQNLAAYFDEHPTCAARRGASEPEPDARSEEGKPQL